MRAYSNAYGNPFLKQLGFNLNCSTKYIVAAVRARMIAEGVAVGAMKCTSLYVNGLTSPSKSECYLTQIKLRMQAEGVVTSSMECTLNLIKQFNGE